MIQDNTPAGGGSGSKVPRSTQPSRPDAMQQVHATGAAKDARLKEAGLGGNRAGEASASVKRAQAARDAKAEQTPATDAPTDQSPVEQDADSQSILVQVNTDHNIKGGEGLTRYVENAVEASLGRFARRLTRVEVHLSDDNAGKSNGDDKRCLLEARPAGHQPVVVTHVAATVDEAVDGACERMEMLLDRTFGKLHDSKDRVSLGESPSL